MTWLLIAEDSEDVREMLAEALRVHGYDVRTSSDGSEALQMLDAATDMPAVVLLDLLMPRVDGRGVLEALRSHARARNVPVVVVTGLELADADISPFKVAEQLQKPVTIERLVSAIENAIAPVATCRVCGLVMVAPNKHNFAALEATRRFGLMRCRMCGKGARVRCILGPTAFWVECVDGHLTRTP